MAELLKTKQDWLDERDAILRELARLEILDWAKDDKVAESIYPYVLVEAINLLLNAVPGDEKAFSDYTSTGEKVKALIENLADLEFKYQPRSDENKSSIKKLIAVELTVPEGGMTVEFKAGHKYVYFVDPETGRYYEPVPGFQVHANTSGSLDALFTEVEVKLSC